MPPSKIVEMKKAKALYKDFTGHTASQIKTIHEEQIRTGFEVGLCDGILYTTTRDGKKESYIHEFKNKSRPTLISNFNGSKINLIGGNYDFTDAGITDR